MEYTIAESSPYFGLKDISAEEFRIKEQQVLNCGLWNLTAIRAYTANKLSKGEGVRVAVLNSGVGYHPDLQAIVGRLDFRHGIDDPLDYAGHGTHIAGIIAGAKTGIASKAEIYSIKVLDDNLKGDARPITLATSWCIENDVDIINISLGGLPNYSLKRVCNAASRKKVLIIAAASHGRYAVYPSAYRNVISVSAVDERLRTYPTEQCYKGTLSAPGKGIFSTDISIGKQARFSPCLRGYYSLRNGASMAAAHVTGAFALAISTAEARGVAIKPRHLIKLARKTALRNSTINVRALIDYINKS